MKLVEILGLTMVNWPNDAAKLITQDADGSICPCNDTGDLAFNGKRWCASGGFIYGMDILPGQPLADDHATAIVTRAQWEAEKMKQAKPAEQENKWIRHRGGKCPVDDEALIDIRRRDGQIVTISSSACTWSHTAEKQDWEIMAYRLHKPEQPSKEEWKALDIAVRDVANDVYVGPFKAGCAADSIKMDIDFPSGVFMPGKIDQIDGPIKWRDRIREIDTTVETLEEERASLIQRLEDEGFKLVRADAKVAPKEPDTDMSDWRNWRVGDVFECIKDPRTNGIKIGGLYSLTYANSNCIGFLDDDQDHRDRGDTENFKFHHRP